MAHQERLRRAVEAVEVQLEKALQEKEAETQMNAEAVARAEAQARAERQKAGAAEARLAAEQRYSTLCHWHMISSWISRLRTHEQDVLTCMMSCNIAATSGLCGRSLIAARVHVTGESCAHSKL